jgi:hypothetical protein
MFAVPVVISFNNVKLGLMMAFKFFSLVASEVFETQHTWLLALG